MQLQGPGRVRASPARGQRRARSVQASPLRDRAQNQLLARAVGVDSGIAGNDGAAAIKRAVVSGRPPPAGRTRTGAAGGTLHTPEPDLASFQLDGRTLGAGRGGPGAVPPAGQVVQGRGSGPIASKRSMPIGGRPSRQPPANARLAGGAAGGARPPAHPLVPHHHSAFGISRPQRGPPPPGAPLNELIHPPSLDPRLHNGLADSYDDYEEDFDDAGHVPSDSLSLPPSSPQLYSRHGEGQDVLGPPQIRRSQSAGDRFRHVELYSSRPSTSSRPSSTGPLSAAGLPRAPGRPSTSGTAGRTSTPGRPSTSGTAGGINTPGTHSSGSEQLVVGEPATASRARSPGTSVMGSRAYPRASRVSDDNANLSAGNLLDPGPHPMEPYTIEQDQEQLEPYTPDQDPHPLDPYTLERDQDREDQDSEDPHPPEQEQHPPEQDPDNLEESIEIVSPPLHLASERDWLQASIDICSPAAARSPPDVAMDSATDLPQHGANKRDWLQASIDIRSPPAPNVHNEGESEGDNDDQGMGHSRRSGCSSDGSPGGSPRASLAFSQAVLPERSARLAASSAQRGRVIAEALRLGSEREKKDLQEAAQKLERGTTPQEDRVGRRGRGSGLSSSLSLGHEAPPVPLLCQLSGQSRKSRTNTASSFRSASGHDLGAPDLLRPGEPGTTGLLQSRESGAVGFLQSRESGTAGLMQSRESGTAGLMQSRESGTPGLMQSRESCAVGSLSEASSPVHFVKSGRRVGSVRASQGGLDNIGGLESGGEPPGRRAGSVRASQGVLDNIGGRESGGKPGNTGNTRPIGLSSSRQDGTDLCPAEPGSTMGRPGTSSFCSDSETNGLASLRRPPPSFDLTLSLDTGHGENGGASWPMYSTEVDESKAEGGKGSWQTFDNVVFNRPYTEMDASGSGT
eukprot:gene26677-4252_t